MVGRLSGALVTAFLLAGTTACGGQPTARSTDAATRSPAASPTPEGNGSMVPPLPELSATPKPSAQPQATPKSRPPANEVFGADVSWPQCPKGMGIPEKRTEGKPMPTAAARFVVIGLTNGPSFVANPCIASQVQWVKDRHLLAAAYSVVS
jgi:hypothetical protein